MKVSLAKVQGVEVPDEIRYEALNSAYKNLPNCDRKEISARRQSLKRAFPGLGDVLALDLIAAIELLCCEMSASKVR